MLNLLLVVGSIVLLCGFLAAQEETTQASDQQTMSAEQIIAILQQDSGILAEVKNGAAQRLGVDPHSITDEELFERIRQNENLRDLATTELRKRGYSVSTGIRKTQSEEEFRTRSADSEEQKKSLADDETIETGNTSGNAPPAGSGTAKTQKRTPAKVTPEAEIEPNEPHVLSLKTPYGELPSLKDLYSQLSPSTVKLKRFGSDTFRRGTGNGEALPMDLPVGPDYVLGPGDSVILNLWGGHSDRLNRTIDRQGQIALPEAGAVAIAGLTITQAQTVIQKALGTQFQGEHVEISTGRLRTVRVYVVGDVQRPGAYDVSSLSTPLNALYEAGGPTSRGSMRILRQYRGNQLVGEIDLYGLLLHGVRSGSDRLLAGDTILVPPVGAQVTVMGMVRRPAIYELRGEQGLNDVLELAGGVVVSANLKQINIERIEAHQRRTMLSVKLSDNKDGQEKKLADIRVQDGDRVLVASILPYDEQTVYLEGHVFRPGKYPYQDGMTINDLLKSYQDVMPEPASHAEIVRLQPPDFRPETIGFDLTGALAGDAPIPLKAFDVIRVFSRYEIDSPKVSIRGEVLRPGEYPLSRGMTAAGLLEMAGGFRRSAYRQVADLSSYVIQDSQKVLVTHSVLAIDKAIEGDKSADVELRPGDVLGIRQLTGWQDIGASITIQGEVKFAGTYGIQEGERLSSILRRAGGFREGAYPAGAVFDRTQVRELGEKSREEMIRRLETTSLSIKPGALAPQEQVSLQQSLVQQQQQVLATLRSHPASARLVLKISADIKQWENTPIDIEVRAGDTLLIPKRPDFVLVMGQVYNATAISYMPGKTADWYLRQAGGVAQAGNKKGIFVVRANGSVVGHGEGWGGSNVLDVRMQPGDSLVVPEKIYGGSQAWKNVMSVAQVMSSMAIVGAAAGIF
jgi:protein involved in polysaccharide export with SLBB domain